MVFSEIAIIPLSNFRQAHALSRGLYVATGPDPTLSSSKTIMGGNSVTFLVSRVPRPLSQVIVVALFSRMVFPFVWVFPL